MTGRHDREVDEQLDSTAYVCNRYFTKDEALLDAATDLRQLSVPLNFYEMTPHARSKSSAKFVTHKHFKFLQ